jgi:aspartate/methionine/tyrosine aminotransferase
LQDLDDFYKNNFSTPLELLLILIKISASQSTTARLRDIGVAAIPLSAFYGNGFDQRVIRFCFAKRDETLQTALHRLSRL